MRTLLVCTTTRLSGDTVGVGTSLHLGPARDRPRRAPHVANASTTDTIVGGVRYEERATLALIERAPASLSRATISSRTQCISRSGSRAATSRTSARAASRAELGRERAQHDARRGTAPARSRARSARRAARAARPCRPRSRRRRAAPASPRRPRRSTDARRDPSSSSSSSTAAMLPAPPQSTTSCPPGRSTAARWRKSASWSRTQWNVEVETIASTGCAASGKRLAEVGVHERHARVAGEALARRFQHPRRAVERDHAPMRQPLQQRRGHLAGAAAGVEHGLVAAQRQPRDRVVAALVHRRVERRRRRCASHSRCVTSSVSVITYDLYTMTVETGNHTAAPRSVRRAHDAAHDRRRTP